MKRVILVLVIALTASVAMAGGTSVPVTMLELEQTGNDEYILKYKTLDTEDYEFDNLPRNTVLTVHLRFSRLLHIDTEGFLTIDKYRRAVELLRKHVLEKRIVRFGRMGRGLCPIKGRLNTYESDALDVYDEKDFKTKEKTEVVYSYCKYK